MTLTKRFKECSLFYKREMNLPDGLYAVKVNKTKVTLKKGKTFKIKAKVIKVKKSKKLMPKKHVATVRYLSTNKKVATVSSSGKIKAAGKGKCNVYAYAHNGVCKKIKVTVK